MIVIWIFKAVVMTVIAVKVHMMLAVSMVVILIETTAEQWLLPLVASIHIIFRTTSSL